MSPLLDSGAIIVLVTLLNVVALAAFGYLCWHQSGLLAMILEAGIVYSNASMLAHTVWRLERKP